MKTPYFILIAFCLCIHPISMDAQAKNDYIWTLGYKPNKPNQHFGGVMFDFNDAIMTPKYYETQCNASQPAVLSSNTGELLAYFNGCTVYSSDHNVMFNGDSINYGHVWEGYCDFAYPGTQDKLFLPWPGDSLKAVLLHIKLSENYVDQYLLYSILEFTTQHPEGIVIAKDQLLLGPERIFLMTATRHANGRDWWILLPKANSNRYYKMLLDSQGVRVVENQNIGLGWEDNNVRSQVVFSPDGSKYIRFNPWKGLDIFDFDRCSGMLSNPIESGPITNPIEGAGGAAVSADSRFLYVANNIYLFQYDLLATDILASRILIDEYDGFLNPFSTTFYQMTLAPDGKIYMFSSNGVKSVHVINHPERHGSACGFVQHAIELPAYVSIGSPNIPYFRLGPIDGSSCDTLGINNVPVADFRYEIDSLVPYRVHFKNRSYFMPETHAWDFGNSIVSMLKEPAFVDYNTHGTYQVCLSVSNGYGQDSFCRTIVLEDVMTSTQPDNEDVQIKVYPNPFLSEIYIDIPAVYSDATVYIYTVLGNEILSQEIISGHNKVSTTAWPQGVYFYSVRKKGDVLKTGRVVKE